MNKLLALVLVLGASVCMSGCSGTNTSDQGKGERKDGGEGKGQPDVAGLVKVIADLDAPEAKRGDAIRAVGAMGPAGKVAVPALVDVMKKSRQPKLRLEATLALGKIGPDAKEAVPALTALMEGANESGDEDLALRRAAARSLGGIGPEAASAVPAINKQLDKEPKRTSKTFKFEPDFYYMVDLSQALAQIDKSSKGVELLIMFLDKGWDLNREMVASLKLTDLEFDYFKQPGIDRYAMRALGAIGPGAKQAIPKLLPYATNGSYRPGEHEIGIDAAKALGEMGPEAREVLPSLRKFLDTVDSSKEHRDAVREAIKKIER